jgi:hypothetical protein
MQENREALARVLSARQRAAGLVLRPEGPERHSDTEAVNRSIQYRPHSELPHGNSPNREPGRPSIPGDGAAGDRGPQNKPADNGGYTTSATCPSQRLPHATTRQESRRVANESWQGKESPHISPNLCGCQSRGLPGSGSADFLVLVRWVAYLTGVLGWVRCLRSEGRLAAVAALKCLEGTPGLCRGPRGMGARMGGGWGMGSVRRVRAGRWAVVAVMLVVLWA